jgi:hypothetical protein
MPELLQEDFTPVALCRILKLWLTDAAAAKEVSGKLAAAVALLQSDGEAIGKIAECIVSPPQGPISPNKGMQS